MSMYTCSCGDPDCMGPCDLVEERDPKEVSLEQTPEACGIGPDEDKYALEALDMEFWSAKRTAEYPYTETTLRGFIKEVMADLRYPMTANIRATLIDELTKWISQLRAVESAGRAPQFEEIKSRTTIKEEAHAG